MIGGVILRGRRYDAKTSATRNGLVDSDKELEIGN